MPATSSGWSRTDFPAGMGAAAVGAALRERSPTKPAGPRTMAVPITIVTKDNVEPYRAVFK